MLIDTNILARTLQLRHPQYGMVTPVFEILTRKGHELHVVPQNLFELWVAATRPIEQNGLGLTPAAAARELARIRSIFEFVPDSAAVYPIWEDLVIQYNVSGKPAHDARLVAAMRANGLHSILTFDARFSRYVGIKAANPTDIISSAV